MNDSFVGLLVVVLLIITMLASIVIGQVIGRRYPAKSGLNITEGAVFTLMGLLVAFMFASANQRFDHRRLMMVEESNIISTAYLRLDILKPADTLLLKKDFLSYVTSRLAIYQSIPDFNKVDIEISQSKVAQTKLWQDAVNACKNAGSPMAAMLVLPSINTMFDMANTRISYTYLHPPVLIFSLLILVSLLSAFLAGYGIAGREDWSSLHIVAFVLITTATIYIIIDLEFPRLGVIKETSFDRHLIELKAEMQKIQG